MSCCGGGRDALRRSAPRPVAARVQPAPTASARRPARSAEVEYRGAGRLTVTGQRTGTVYHFDAPGARVRVQGPDVALFAMIPTLRVVR